MTHPLTTPLFLSDIDPTSNPHELIQSDFLDAIQIDRSSIQPDQPCTQPTTTEIRNAVISAMKATDFPQEDIDDLLTHISQDQGKFLFSGTHANTVARKHGFASIHKVSDLKKTPIKSKHYQHELSPKYYLEISRTISSLKSDNIAKNFCRMVHDFVKLPQRDIHRIQNPQKKRLAMIHANTHATALKLIRNKPPTVSLAQYSRQSHYPARLIPTSLVTAILKTSKAPQPSTTTTFNCFRLAYSCQRTIDLLPP